MAITKTAYSRTTWVNNQSPDIDADHLNKIETALVADRNSISDLSDAVDGKIGYDRGKVIASGTDLDDLDVGTYYSPDASTSASLVNTPHTTGGFRLDVLGHSAATSLIQILYPNSTLVVPYFRMMASSTWGAWKKIGLDLTNYCDGVNYDTLAEGIHASIAKYVAEGGRTAGRQNLTLTVRVGSNYWTGTACWATSTVCCGMLTSSNKDHNVIYKFRDATTDDTATLTQFTMTAVS